MSVCPPGSLDDWDTAVQKTESRLNRVNQQRVKVCVGQATNSTAPIYRQRLSPHGADVVTAIRLLRRRRCWLTRKRSEPSSAGRPGRRRKQPRRTFRRELQLERRGRRKTDGATTRVGRDNSFIPKYFYCIIIAITPSSVALFTGYNAFYYANTPLLL